MKFWQTLLIYLISALFLLVYRHEITDWMMYSRPPYPLMFLITLGFLLIPVVPFKIIIGLLGYLYGPLFGAVFSWAAASIASILVYWAVRFYFQKQGRSLLGKYKRLEKWSVMLEKNPFLTILLARLIPIFPQAIVNIYPAFLSIRFLTFATASTLGKIPAILVFSYLGKSMFTDLNTTLLVVGLYGIFLLLVYIVYRLWLKNRLV
ncbi:TVP38/TMEM64 family protein [Paenibacillus nasutitermitis]|uniref:TVP38/TMEM64 family membrane protein n=1 Tax=Paenibacillus nasutitermitis TaxID=1652958 RepID=A0A916YRT5_9BACL|nr:VTT domain-containing protein [Paenibacillus nasutitermitis]GGD56668.1 TVP38/TMEM64 family protein [Paenibacillus nasutitermitis]